MKILLISGHGAGDPGAVGTYQGKTYREADETRNVTKVLAAELAGDCTVTVYPTDRNAFEDHKKGTLKATARFSQYNYVLEVHFNALKSSTADGKTKGVEIYVPTTETDTRVERAIVNAVSKCGLTNRGVKKHNWSVIAKARQSGVHAALLEVCFIDDADDMAVYNRKFNDIVRAISSGLISGLNLKKEEPVVTYDTFKEYMDQYLMEQAVKAPASWSSEERAWAESNGIIQGDDQGRKKYKSNVTREELVTMLYRALQK